MCLDIFKTVFFTKSHQIAGDVIMAVKICSNCNEQFDEAAIVCKYCGLPTVRIEEEHSSLPVKDKKSRKLVLSIVLALIAIVIIALVMFIKM
jgi:predicted amidophosphoribosyltransferase